MQIWRYCGTLSAMDFSNTASCSDGKGVLGMWKKFFSRVSSGQEVLCIWRASPVTPLTAFRDKVVCSCQVVNVPNQHLFLVEDLGISRTKVEDGPDCGLR